MLSCSWKAHTCSHSHGLIHFSTNQQNETWLSHTRDFTTMCVRWGKSLRFTCLDFDPEIFWLQWAEIWNASSLRWRRLCAFPPLNRLFESFPASLTFSVCFWCNNNFHSVVFLLLLFVFFSPQAVPVCLRSWWFARGCVICLIFGCARASSCQLNIRHIPTESGADFWYLLEPWEKRPLGGWGGGSPSFRWGSCDIRDLKRNALLTETVEFSSCFEKYTKRCWKSGFAV